MTTNNPPIAAWAPSTAMRKLASRHNNASCVLTDGPAEFNDVALVRLSDYEALQAECEKLRKDAERYRWLREAHSAHPISLTICSANDWGLKPWSGDDPDAAIDAAIQEERKP